MSVDTLGLPDRLLAACNRARFRDVSQIMLASQRDLERLRLSPRDVQELTTAAAEALGPPTPSLLDLLVGNRSSSSHAGPSKSANASEGGMNPPRLSTPQRSALALSNDHDLLPASSTVLGKRRAMVDGRDEISSLLEIQGHPSACTITTGDKEMDAALGGGIRNGCITEILGEPSSGKSQLIMQVAAFTALGLQPLNALPDESQIQQPARDGDSELFHDLRGIGVARDGGGTVIIVTGNKAQQGVLAQRMEDVANAAIRERWRLRGNLRTSSVPHRTVDTPPRQGSDDSHSHGARSTAGYNTPATSAEEVTHAPSVYGPRASLVSEEDRVAQRAVRLLLSRVVFAHRFSQEGLDHIVTSAIPDLMRRLYSGQNPCSSSSQVDESAPGGLSPPATPPSVSKPLRLVIIDSLPEIVSPNPKAWSRGLMGRANYLTELSDKLQRLSLLRFGPDGQLTSQPNIQAAHPQAGAGLAVVVTNWSKLATDAEKTQAKSAVLRGFAGPLPSRGTREPVLFPQELLKEMEEGTSVPLLMAAHSVHESGVLASVPRNLPAKNNSAGSFDLFLSRVEERMMAASFAHAWTKCINVRLMLCRSDRRIPRSIAPFSLEFDSGLPLMVEMRRAVVVFSPFVLAGTQAGRSAERDFFILPSGVKCVASHWATSRDDEKHLLTDEEEDVAIVVRTSGASTRDWDIGGVEDLNEAEEEE